VAPVTRLKRWFVLTIFDHAPLGQGQVRQVYHVSQEIKGTGTTL